MERLGGDNEEDQETIQDVVDRLYEASDIAIHALYARIMAGE